jgi:hypothetical protein
VQFAELQAAAAVIKVVSAQRQLNSLGEQVDLGRVAMTHFD